GSRLSRSSPCPASVNLRDGCFTTRPSCIQADSLRLHLPTKLAPHDLTGFFVRNRTDLADSIGHTHLDIQITECDRRRSGNQYARRARSFRFPVSRPNHSPRTPCQRRPSALVAVLHRFPIRTAETHIVPELRS